MKQSNLNKRLSSRSVRCLLAGLILVGLSGCAGGGITPYLISALDAAGPHVPNEVRKALPFVVQATAHADALAEKKRQEELLRQKQEERRKMLAAMTPQQLKEFLRREQQQAQFEQEVITTGVICLMGSVAAVHPKHLVANPVKIICGMA